MISFFDVTLDLIFVQKVAEFKANGNNKKSSSKKLEPTTAAPLPPKNGFKKFDGFNDDELDWNEDLVSITNFTNALEGLLLRWDYKDLLNVVPVNNTALFDTRFVNHRENK